MEAIYYKCVECGGTGKMTIKEAQEYVSGLDYDVEIKPFNS